MLHITFFAQTTTNINEEIIKRLNEFCLKNNFYLSIKPHTGHKERDRKRFIKLLDKRFSVYPIDYDVYNILVYSDIVIAINSTILLEAILFRKKIINIYIPNSTYFRQPLVEFPKNSCAKNILINDLEKTIIELKDKMFNMRKFIKLIKGEFYGIK